MCIRDSHVPYKGSAQCLTDLASGQIQLIFDNLTSIAPHVKAGRVRGLGVSSLRRSLIFPDIPTIAEAGVPGYETNSWGGMVVPVRTPRAIVTRLNAEINKALQSPELRERYAAIEAEPTGGTPEQFAASLRRAPVALRDPAAPEIYTSSPFGSVRCVSGLGRRVPLRTPCSVLS